MPIVNQDRYPNEVFFDESDFLEIGTRSDGARIIQVGVEGDAPLVALAYTSNINNEDLHAIELDSLMKYSQDPSEYEFYPQPKRFNQNVQVIYKYKVPEQGQFSLNLAVGAEILTVQAQEQNLCLWVLLNPKFPKVQRDFLWIRTGQEIGHNNINYITTLQFDNGKRVSHLFELKVDYNKLEKLLAKGQWREADLETFEVLGKLCGIDNSPSGQIISQIGISNLSPSVLQTLDRLWLKYSNGKFGYSAQIAIGKKIKNFITDVESNQSAWKTFCTQLGWNTGFAALNFSPNAPKGHLPAIVGWGMGLGPCIFEDVYRHLWSKFNDQE